jgi:porin
MPHSTKFAWWGWVTTLALGVVCLDPPGANADDTKTPATLGFLTPSTPGDPLAQLGIQFSATYIGEVLGNPSGGVRQGTVVTGRLDLGADIDLDRMIGWTGAKFHANMYQINGQGLSRDYIGNLMLVSNIEALTSTRLYELWIEQSLLNNRLAIRAGQQAADVEFFDSIYDDIFINSSAGWPAILAIDLPGGGPSPPLAVPGIRVKAQLSDPLTAYVAIFDGNAAGPGAADPQLLNPNGLAFRVNDPPLLIGQLRYGFDVGQKGKALPAAIEIGGWYHAGTFSDQRFTAQGVPLANPLGSGVPNQLQTNHGLFLLYEQLLARAAPESDKGIGFFTRASVAPSDRNLVDLYLDGGVQFSGLIASRANDTFGVALEYIRISDAAQQYNRDQQFFTGLAIPIRDYEAVLELTYQAEIRAGWTLQPTFQYVVHPAGGAADPNDPSHTLRLKNAAVFGLRTTLKF